MGGPLRFVGSNSGPKVALRWFAPKPDQTIGILNRNNTYRVFGIPLI